MAFRLLIEIDENQQVKVEHEGQIDPIALLGTIRMLEYDILTAARSPFDIQEVATEEEGDEPTAE